MWALFAITSLPDLPDAPKYPVPRRDQAASLTDTDVATVQSQLILIIEDDEKAAVATATLLQDEGYGVLVAHDGAEGLEIATERHPDLVLLDVRLPALDGHEVLAQLKRRRIDTRVIVHSAHEKSAEHVVRLMRAGACDHVPKPTKYTHLLQRIKRALSVEHPLISANATAELQNEVAALKAQTRRLEHENKELKEQIASHRAERQRAVMSARLLESAVSVAYLSVAVGAAVLLAHFGLVRGGTGIAVLAVVLFLLLLLPMQKVRKVTARMFRSEAHMEMHEGGTSGTA